MAKALRVGDQVQLPSGRRVGITVAAEPGRAWSAVLLGHEYACARRRAGAAGVEYYFAGARAPLQLDEQDALALAAALNRVTG